MHFSKSSRLKEVFGIMRADDISAVAKSDSLICLCRASLLSEHKRQQSATVVANKIRELTSLTNQNQIKSKTFICKFYNICKK